MTFDPELKLNSEVRKHDVRGYSNLIGSTDIPAEHTKVLPSSPDRFLCPTPKKKAEIRSGARDYLRNNVFAHGTVTNDDDR